MHIVRQDDVRIAETKAATRVLLVTADGPLGTTARLLLGLDAVLDVQGQLYDALSHLLDDPRLADVVVVDCDGFGGLEKVQRAISMICPDDRRAPFVLMSSDCAKDAISLRRTVPTRLAHPVAANRLQLVLSRLHT